MPCCQNIKAASPAAQSCLTRIIIDNGEERAEGGGEKKFHLEHRIEFYAALQFYTLKHSIFSLLVHMWLAPSQWESSLYSTHSLLLLKNTPEKFTTLHYGNRGCGIFKGGIQNWKGFCIRINIPKGNFWILRIGLAGSLSSLQKSELLKLIILIFHVKKMNN